MIKGSGSEWGGIASCRFKKKRQGIDGQIQKNCFKFFLTTIETRPNIRSIEGKGCCFGFRIHLKFRTK